MNRSKLIILAHEAERQRALDTIYMSKAFAGDKDEMIPKTLKIHGPYTVGFHEGEHAAMIKRFSGNS